MAALQADSELDEIADRLGFDGWRRRATRWFLHHDRPAVATQFSLVDLLTLGGGIEPAKLRAWGAPSLYVNGCACLWFPTSRSWRILEGRAQVPMMAATMSDLSLAVAIALRDLGLPAALARPVLSIGMQDFIDELAVRDNNDWWTLSRQAQGLRRQRVEDYVSAAAAVNGPLVLEEAGVAPD